MNKIKIAGTVFAALLVADIFILGMGMAQIAVEGRSGAWAPWWSIQADFIINHL